MADLFGMIHLPSLRFNNHQGLTDIVDYAVQQAKILNDLNYDGIIIENFGDIPFAKTKVDDTVIGKLAIICYEVRKSINAKIGLNILRNATVQSMKIASVLGLDFIRSNIWEGAYVTDQGIIEGVAYEVMKTKEMLNSDVEVYADVFVKHATPLSDFSIVEAAQQALDRGGADRIIISGRHTGGEIDFSALDELNQKKIYPIIGSGFTENSIAEYENKISGAIVGTAIKQNDVTSPIDPEKASSLQQAWNKYMKN